MPDITDALLELHSQSRRAFIDRLGLAQERHPNIQYTLPPGFLDYGNPWVLSGDWMLVGDIHAPTCRYDLAAMVAEIAKKHLKRPRRLLIGGDLLNMDTFSTYDVIVEPPTWAQERDAARALLSDWFGVFDEIRAIPGNHERRLQRYTAGAFETADLMSLIISNPDKLRMNHYGWCWIDTAAGRWRVTHPKSYSVNQLMVAEAIAHKYECHVISFHEHHLGIGWDRYKHFCIVNGGSLADFDRIPYLALDDKRTAAHAIGFVMLKNGVPHIFGEPPMTDWSEWL